jgi:hypothetical protein
MYLLYKTYGDNGDFYILYYPDELKTDYDWLKRIDIIGEIILTSKGKKEFLDELLLEKLYSIHEFLDKDYNICYNSFKQIPKKAIKYIISKWKESKFRESMYGDRIKYLEENLDKIYDELMIKDIIE